jgi:hypothetical protein
MNQWSAILLLKGCGLHQPSEVDLGSAEEQPNRNNLAHWGDVGAGINFLAPFYFKGYFYLQHKQAALKGLKMSPKENYFSYRIKSTCKQTYLNDCRYISLL